MARSFLTTAAMAAVFLALAAGGTVQAQEPEVYEITIQDHRFTPDELEIPAGKEAKLVIKNLDPTPEEFESYELNREKIVPAHGEISVYLDPLEPGSYPFFGEFNQSTAQGKIIVK